MGGDSLLDRVVPVVLALLLHAVVATVLERFRSVM